MSDEPPIYKQMMHQIMRDQHMRNQYIAGMDVDDIANVNQCDTWIVQRAILGAAYGKPQRDVTG